MPIRFHLIFSSGALGSQPTNGTRTEKLALFVYRSPTADQIGTMGTGALPNYIEALTDKMARL